MYNERKVFYTARDRLSRVQYKENFEFIVHLASALFVNKTRTKKSPTHLAYYLSSMLAPI